MTKRFLDSKIRDVRITGAFLEYEGSITIDEDYIEAAGMLPYQEVHVLNLENGKRFTTYIIKGVRGSKAVELNGPAAREGVVGDRLMVLAYVALTPEEIPLHTPRVVSAKSFK